jgi:predicted nuclease of predicted toxin-antitoxin system/chorismate-pyruvate lyase
MSVYDEARGLEDDQILARAYMENRVLINSDKDFGELIFREKRPHHGVILLRLHNPAPANQIAAIENLLRNTPSPLADQFVVITDAGIRIVASGVNYAENPGVGKPLKSAGPDLQTLLALFPPADYFQKSDLVPGDQVPEPYHHLLVHEHHMTVTVEAHYGSLVDVRILDKRQDETSYARRILLALRNSGRIVQFGIMRVRLEFCSLQVREAIVAGKTPLGRILINNGVLRRIEPTAFLRIIPGPDMMKWFDLTEATLTYGRLAYIHCDGKPAIELLEIVAPERMPV